jgi:hypothetical protein
MSFQSIKDLYHLLFLLHAQKIQRFDCGGSNVSVSSVHAAETKEDSGKLIILALVKALRVLPSLKY